jgi:hypothetical protein
MIRYAIAPILGLPLLLLIGSSAAAQEQAPESRPGVTRPADTPPDHPHPAPKPGGSAAPS